MRFSEIVLFLFIESHVSIESHIPLQDKRNQAEHKRETLVSVRSICFSLSLHKY